MRITTRRTLQLVHLVLSIGASAVSIGIPLLGLVLGIAHLPQGYGLLSKPGPVLTLMYVGMWLGWIWIGYRLVKAVSTRSGIRPSESSLATLMYTITVPFTVLWVLTFGELLGWPRSGPTASAEDLDLAGALFLFGGGALVFGGGVVASVVLSIDRFFNPGDHEDAQQSRI